MTLKVLLCLCLLKLQAEAGLVSIPEEHHHHHYEHHEHEHEHEHEHLPIATSYMHFHGPVEGPAFEVKVPYVIPHHYEEDHHHQDGNELQHEHHHEFLGHTTDYVAHPKYEFSYGVEDHHSGDFHGQKEVRDGTSVTGEYSVKEPGGRLRVVKYKADKDGFHAEVEHKGKNLHPYHYEHKHHHLQLSDESHYQYSHDV